MMFILFTWICTSVSCAQLPEIGPLAAADCRAMIPRFATPPGRSPYWIEAACEPHIVGPLSPATSPH
jgi:hypothetical protein